MDFFLAGKGELGNLSNFFCCNRGLMLLSLRKFTIVSDICLIEIDK